MRDKLKDNEYFKKRINTSYEGIERFYHWIKIGKTPKDRILIVKRSMSYSYVDIVSAKYSAGYPITDLTGDLLNAINLTDKSWIDDEVKFYSDRKGGCINQFVEFDQMLWMLSLGYLLDISNNEFQKLVDVIDRHRVKDFLYEFIIRAKIKDRKPITEESYEYGWLLFGKLRQAITETDKTKAEQLVKEFVTKDWYKEHKSTAWYNSHKSIHDTYFGYWSFETAAVVKIMGLDDSSFRDCQYYPKDLADYDN